MLALQNLNKNILACAEKAAAGERLSLEEGLLLAQEAPIGLLSLLAERQAEARHGKQVFYNVNLHLNLTNVCEADCFFCSFARLEEGMAEAKTYHGEDILRYIEERVSPEATEVHIVNGLHPGLPFSYYLDALRAIRNRFPQLHIKGFTAVEIAYYAKKYDMTTLDTLKALVDAGLGSLPGGGAEVFADRVRKKICRNKVDGPGWLQVHREAHGLGLKSNATLLFGTVETWEERLDHMVQLRALQDETRGFMAFIPLAFHNENNKLWKVKEPTAQTALRVTAVSRLMLDNFPHIKAYWMTLTPHVAQSALAFGASDMDGTVVSEKIYRMAGTESPTQMSIQELERQIREAGKTPVRRNTLYEIVGAVAG